MPVLWLALKTFQKHQGKWLKSVLFPCITLVSQNQLIITISKGEEKSGFHFWSMMQFHIYIKKIYSEKWFK